MARPAREPRPNPLPDEHESVQSALRGRWVTDARHESNRTPLDERVRSRQLRQRLEEAYRTGAQTTATTSVGQESRIEPLDLVV